MMTLWLSSLIALKHPRLYAEGDPSKSWQKESLQHFIPSALSWLKPFICIQEEMRDQRIKHQMPGKIQLLAGVSSQQLAEQT